MWDVKYYAFSLLKLVCSRSRFMLNHVSVKWAWYFDWKDHYHSQDTGNLSDLLSWIKIRPFTDDQHCLFSFPCIIQRWDGTMSTISSTHILYIKEISKQLNHICPYFVFCYFCTPFSLTRNLSRFPFSFTPPAFSLQETLGTGRGRASSVMLYH